MTLECYLDNNATTALLPSVKEAMWANQSEAFANPSSQHQLGFRARRVVEDVRAEFAAFLGADHSGELLFTAGATDSIARAFQEASRLDLSRIITIAVDHVAVRRAAQAASSTARDWREIGVDGKGQVDLDTLVTALKEQRALVSITLVNNETGIISAVEHVARACEEHGAILHIDAAQAVGRVDVNVKSLRCDLLSISAHKFHGPKGVGVLYSNARLGDRALGASAEAAGGTLNVDGIIGAGAALRELADWRARARTIEGLRDKLERGARSALPGVSINGAEAPRVANTTNIFFPNRSAADVVAGLSAGDVYVSAGAACSNGAEPSHVLQAMGLGKARANSSVRFSLSTLTSEADIDRAIGAVKDVCASTPVLQYLAE